MDKRIKSFNLFELSHKKRFFEQLKIIQKHNQDCFSIDEQLEKFKKSEFVHPWLNGEIQT